MDRRWLGLCSYREGLKKQQEFLEQKKEAILGMEHSSVISLGIRSKEESDLKQPVDKLRQMGFDVVRSPRGGRVTLHNRGQLVVYPILNLQERKISVRNFVSSLLDQTEQLLRSLNIEVFCKGTPGLYTSKGKIAFFGLKISQGWSSHGLAINVQNNLEEFGWIQSCGEPDECFDKVENYDKTRCAGLFEEWCGYIDSNDGPSGCRPDALPAELHPQVHETHSTHELRDSSRNF